MFDPFDPHEAALAEHDEHLGQLDDEQTLRDRIDEYAPAPVTTTPEEPHA